ncbi:uncharacterized protein [Mollivirus kamchatka]|nr:uncharacterized protein [Mollivirus kamchatka]
MKAIESLLPRACEPGEWVNWVVALSNVFGLLPICRAQSSTQIAIATTAVAASVLMHISERKHDLPGVAPFSQWSNKFLMADRIVSYGTVLYAASQFFQAGLHTVPWATALVGCSALALSEHVDLGPAWFIATHCTWHACAFYGLAIAFNAK